MNKKKTCKHFRGEIPGYESDELRIEDQSPCEVCDIVDRTLKIGEEIIFIPKFNIIP
jgi:hypothetical protein